LKRFQREEFSDIPNVWKLTNWRSRFHFGFYNFVRVHKTLGTTPAVAAGLEEKAVEFRTAR
jgi:hypothetical protein